MKKGNLLLLIITLLIVSIVVVFGLIILRRNNTKVPIIIDTNMGGDIEVVTNINDYYMVKNCVDKFYKYYATMFDTKEDEDISKTYTLLDKSYIEFKGITTENMLTVLERKGDVITNISNMYVSKQNEYTCIYIVEGKIREVLTNEISDFQIMIRVDSKNNTFSVLLQDYIQEKHRNIELGAKLKVQLEDNLENKRYNLYVEEEITEAEYAISLVDDYKEKALYYPEQVYESLDEEYRNVKFGTLAGYKEYVEANKTQINNIKITQYQKAEVNNYTKYICVDEEERYYIFTELGLMKYSLVLDTYTINLPEFLEEYNKANMLEKVGYNIQKCLDAINYKDYEYVYKKLDFEFKAVNYPTLESFEKAIKKNLFEKNMVKMANTSYEGTTCIYKLVILDMEDNTKEKNMTIIMQLKEETNFVMSLSFQ